MVKLTTPYDSNAEFLFKDMKSCGEFMNVFRDHWCNIVWNTPEQQDSFPEANTEYWKKHINDSPKVLADNNLSWGFSLLKDKGLDKELTPEQSQFVANMVERISKENECNA